MQVITLGVNGSFMPVIGHHGQSETALHEDEGGDFAQLWAYGLFGAILIFGNQRLPPHRDVVRDYAQRLNFYFMEDYWQHGLGIDVYF